MTLNMFLVLAFLSLKNCYAFKDGLYKGSNCEVEGKPGICKVLVDCLEEYQRVVYDGKQARKRCSFSGGMEVVCCETRATDTEETGKKFFDIRSRDLEINILCSFNGTLPVRCCPTDQAYAPPLQEAGCPPPKAIEQTDNIIKRKCLEYSQNGFPCMRQRTGQFLRQGVCFQAKLFANRIVGGNPTKPFEYPHMVMLGYKLRNENIWANGGTLISERAVLTAAHAVSTFNGDVQQVCMGLHDRRRACRNELRYPVTDIRAHGKYVPRVTHYDIAILFLARSVVMNEYVRPACLPYSKSEGLMNELDVTGWGLTSDGGTASDVLLKTTIDEFENKYCEEKHVHFPPSPWLPHGWLADTMMCAGSMKGQNDSCQGDSGGPLQTLTEDSIPCSYVVVGVVSSGTGCGTVGVPGIYTRVSGFTDWIVKEIWPHG